jgi:hypothetical protein
LESKLEKKIPVIIYEERSSGKILRILRKDELSDKMVLDEFIRMGLDLFNCKFVEKELTEKELVVLDALYGVPNRTLKGEPQQS